MKFVYSRVAGASAAGLAGEVDRGWLGGALARRMPHRRAWIAVNHASRGGNDIWRAMGLTAPAPQRRPSAPAHGEQAYILQQDPDGLWFVDPWGDSVGTIRPAGSASSTSSTSSTGAFTAPANSGRDLGNTCFIIELGHAQR